MLLESSFQRTVEALPSVFSHDRVLQAFTIQLNLRLTITFFAEVLVSEKKILSSLPFYQVKLWHSVWAKKVNA